MTGAECRGFAWQLLDLGESLKSEKLRRIGAELADVAMLLDLGSEHESAADLEAVALYLRRQAASEAHRLIEDDARRGAE